MKTKREVMNRIASLTASNLHILDCYPATIDINAPRALMQLAIKTALDELYWVLEKKRPQFKCDDMKKINY